MRAAILASMSDEVGDVSIDLARVTSLRGSLIETGGVLWCHQYYIDNTDVGEWDVSSGLGKNGRLVASIC